MDDVLTGQVPIWTECHKHDEVSHDREGAPSWRWCNTCGWNRVLGFQARADR